MPRAGESESRLQSTAHPQQLRLETVAIDDSADIMAGQSPDALPKTYNEGLSGDGWLNQIAWAGADDPQPPRFGQARTADRLQLLFESACCWWRRCHIGASCVSAGKHTNSTNVGSLHGQHFVYSSR